MNGYQIKLTRLIATLAVTDVKSTSGMGLDLEHSDSHLVHV